MAIPINIDRLNRAVQQIIREFGVTTADGKYKHRLRCGPAHKILERMNDLRLEDKEWHSALQSAAVAQKGISRSRRALYRKAISRYGKWTYRALLKAKYRGPELAFYAGAEIESQNKVGGTIAPTCDEHGQLGFIK